MKLTYIFYATCECGPSIPVFVVICQYATADAGPCENLGRTAAGPHENLWDEPRKSQRETIVQTPIRFPLRGSARGDLP